MNEKEMKRSTDRLHETHKVQRKSDRVLFYDRKQDDSFSRQNCRFIFASRQIFSANKVLCFKYTTAIKKTCKSVVTKVSDLLFYCEYLLLLHFQQISEVIGTSNFATANKLICTNQMILNCFDFTCYSFWEGDDLLGEKKNHSTPINAMNLVDKESS